MPPSSRRQAIAHRAIAFHFSNPLFVKNPHAPKGAWGFWALINTIDAEILINSDCSLNNRNLCNDITKPIFTYHIFQSIISRIIGNL